MRILAYAFTVIILIIGCTLPPQKNIPKDSLENIVELQTPGDQPYESSKVYVDSVRKSLIDDQLMLVISGSFPDGCSHLESAKHSTDEEEVLYLELSAWRNSEQMCTQALTPFTYLYDEVTEEELSNYSEVIINDSTYQL